MPTLDSDLRRLAATMVDQGPEPPAFDELHPVPLPARSRRRLASAVAASLIVGAIVLAIAIDQPWNDGSSRRRITSPATSGRFDAICRDDPGTFTNANGATFGPMVPDDFTGTVSPEVLAQGPQFVAVGCGDNARIAGWVKTADILQSQNEKPLPDYYNVYDKDGTTIVGRYFLPTSEAGCGFVAAAEQPEPCSDPPTENPPATS